MVAVRMMQVAVDDVVGVIAVRNGGVAAGGAVSVARRLFARAVSGSALVGIRGADGEDMVIYVAGMHVMQMA
jgi:hypothetical protein